MKTKVLYVAGYERSGSTIFHDVLGQVERLSACGEVRQLWHRALIQDRPCGCGVDPLRDCSHWRHVFEDAFGGIENVDPEEKYVYRLRSRNRHFPLLLLPGGRAAMRTYLTGYIDPLRRLYSALGRVGKGGVVVDSSKSPTHAWLLSAIPTIDVFVVHLTRDPRGVLNSVLKRKRDGHEEYKNYTPRRTVFEWMVVNGMAEQIESRFDVPYLQVQYETFVQTPERVVQTVLEWIGEEAGPLSFIDGCTVQKKATHTVGGSPHGFTTGAVQLREDDQWKTNLRQAEIEKVEWWAWRSMSRYGYATQ